MGFQDDMINAGYSDEMSYMDHLEEEAMMNMERMFSHNRYRCEFDEEMDNLF